MNSFVVIITHQRGACIIHQNDACCRSVVHDKQQVSEHYPLTVDDRATGRFCIWRPAMFSGVYLLAISIQVERYEKLLCMHPLIVTVIFVVRVVSVKTTCSV